MVHLQQRHRKRQQRYRKRQQRHSTGSEKEDCKLISTTLCYIEKDNKYLMLHRDKKEKDLNAQKWIGVGGKFEPGETVTECLVREVYEETGLTLTAYEFVGMIKFISNTYEAEDMYLFKGTDFIGELKPDCNEGTLRWVEATTVLDLPTWEGDKYFLKPMLEGKRNLNITLSYEGDTLVKVLDLSEEVQIDTSVILQSRHAFSTRIGGISDKEFGTLNLGMNRGDEPVRVTENWRRFMEKAGIGYKPFVCGKQVHGNVVHVATHEDARPAYGEGELIEADGYVTKEKGLPLAIFTADCVPVLLEDTTAGVVGAVHCGWRSTVADIEANAIEKMVELGAKTCNIRIAIGPAINRCCFEVGPEVIDAVKWLIGDKEAAAFYDAKSDGKYMLDLKGVVACRFEQLGVPGENMEMVGECTMCHPEKYYSHRYSNGSRGSLASVIEL